MDNGIILRFMSNNLMASEYNMLMQYSLHCKKKNVHDFNHNMFSFVKST